ncbi:glycoside hydrolase family 95 protein [Xanthomonas hortorum]|uniref:glycoside hydrolase family 95 protein n=1 Tax=Xanthomonas hortorum TaxID=56454 RepID=UPI0015D58603|nr:glycoside hydrolase family 95 protein [Xanthomonas hortorum]MCE4357957.1 glycoside hydrolase family 95 protein [Xanthomonas hortorum pv. taraxaci]
MLTRREVCKATGAALAVLGAAPAASAVAAPAKAAGKQSLPAAAAGDALQLWYREPANEWVQALPVGNGRLGAMVWGGIAHERLQLNEDTLYAGGPYDATSPEALAALPQVRALIFAGRYVEAETLADAKMLSRPLKQMPYQPLGDLLLDFDRADGISEYRRQLDLDTGVATTAFRSGGAVHKREVFVSAQSQCIVVRLSCDRPRAISLRVGIDSPQTGEVTVEQGGLLFSGRNGSFAGIDGKLRFALRVLPQIKGGTVSDLRDRLRIEGADEVVLLLTAATSYQRYDAVDGDPLALTAASLKKAGKLDYAALLRAHLADHQRLFRRVAIDLGTSEAAKLPTDERVQAFAKGNDPAMAALYHQFGRYLLICSSRPGSQPANLQGIWNDLMQPPWESKYTININTEMNYWPSEANALHECVEPLESMLFDLAKTGAHTARAMYDAPGWVVHNNTDLWRQAGPIDGAKWSLWPMGGVWLLQQLWDRWDYGRDRAYLGKIYPLFKGAAEFFVATLVKDPQTGAMVTNPSISPENQHPFNAALCAGPTMDAQLLRDLFAQCIAMSKLLKVDDAFAQHLSELREQLPPNRIGKAGQLQEWQQDWDMQAPEIHHRHVSHLYALHPSSQINLRDTPELAAAAKRTLETRGDNTTGWGIGWRLNLWARLADGEHAYRILQLLISPERTYPNLFDAHPPFQIDGNFGGTAGITEMLLQSWGGSVFLLPALPSAWPRGSVRGLRIRGGASVDLEWDGGRLQQARVHSDRGGRYQLSYAGQILDLELGAGRTQQVGLNNNRLVTQ